MDLLRRLHINLEWFILHVLTLLDSHRPGWLVMCQDDEGDWHCLSQGVEFGMDYHTGRFNNRADASAFAQHLNALAFPGERYFVTHEKTHPNLPETY